MSEPMILSVVALVVAFLSLWLCVRARNLASISPYSPAERTVARVRQLSRANVAAGSGGPVEGLRSRAMSDVGIATANDPADAPWVRNGTIVGRHTEIDLCHERTDTWITVKADGDQAERVAALLLDLLNRAEHWPPPPRPDSSVPFKKV